MSLTNEELKWATLLALTEAPVKGEVGPGPEPIEGPYLVFYSNGRFSLKTANLSKNWDGLLEYSKNLTTWNEWLGEEILADNNIIYLRGTNNTRVSGQGLYTDPRFILDSNEYVYCLGNIETLLDYSSFSAGVHPKMAGYCFGNLFRDCESLRSSPVFPDTIIPFSTGAQSTSMSFFYGMFLGCTNLLEGPPSMPKYGLGSFSCEIMFKNCTSLERAPELPATDLYFNPHSDGNNCYNQMFYGCTGLKYPPSELPASVVTDYAYSNMFYGCSSLKSPPKILAESYYGLGNYGNFNNMFQGCSSLETLPRLYTLSLGTHYYMQMFYGCSSIKLSRTQTGPYVYSYRIPDNGTGTRKGSDSYTLYQMFTGTGGPFTGTPSINTTYYTDHEPV